MAPQVDTSNNIERNEGDAPLAKSKRVPKVCRACGTMGVKNRCGGCRQVFFCDRECQKQIWLEHREECHTLAASATRISLTTPVTSSTISNNIDKEQQKEVNSKHEIASSSSGGFLELLRSRLLGSSFSTSDAIPERNEEKISQSDTVIEQSTRQLDSTVSKPNRSVVPSSSMGRTDQHHAEETNDIRDTAQNEVNVTTGRKHKKKKNRKNKTRSLSMHVNSSEPIEGVKRTNRCQSMGAKKHVMWGNVSAREFTRFPGGGSTVPYDGTWALGLGVPVSDVQLGSVLEREEFRMKTLEARAKEVAKGKRSSISVGETRQFDYKRGSDNPLFRRLSERERKKVFTDIELISQEETSLPVRKGSISTREMDEEILVQDFSCVSVEQLNEFAKIRDSREDACGCSCGDLVKKVSKMNVKRLHQFLSDRGVVIPSHSKSEVLAIAKKIALEEKNCSNSKECECSRNGVECHSNVCVGCAKDCHNPHQMYMYKRDEVQAYRKHHIAKWQQLMCQTQQPVKAV